MTGVRRGTIAALTAVLLVTGAGGLPGASGDDRLADSQTQVSRSANRGGPCKDYLIRPRLGLEEVQRRSELLVRCVAARFDPPGSDDFAVCVARRESGLWPRAVSPGGHVGLFQHVRSAWPGRARTHLRPRWHWLTRDGDPATVPSPFNAWANAVVSLRMARGGRGPRPAAQHCREE